MTLHATVTSLLQASQSVSELDSEDRLLRWQEIGSRAPARNYFEKRPKPTSAPSLHRQCRLAAICFVVHVGGPDPDFRRFRSYLVGYASSGVGAGRGQPKGQQAGFWFVGAPSLSLRRVCPETGLCVGDKSIMSKPSGESKKQATESGFRAIKPTSNITKQAKRRVCDSARLVQLPPPSRHG